MVQEFVLWAIRRTLRIFILVLSMACAKSHSGWALVLALAASTSGCGSNPSAALAIDGCLGLQGDPPPLALERPDYDQHFGERHPASCAFGEGDYTERTVGPDAPRPPADFSVVVVMLENRSFDNYLNGVPDTDYARDREVPDPDPRNPARVAGQYRETAFCTTDTPHEWGPSHLQFDNGLMDGFAAVSRPGGCRAMGYYTEDDLPFVHALARKFAVSDRHFASLMGPTWPNRLFLFSATTCGYTEGAETNQGLTADCGLKRASIFTLMRDRHIPFKVYDESGLASVSVGLGAVRDHVGPLVQPETIEQFEKDARADSLPRFAMVGASTGQLRAWGLGGVPEDDDHPPSDVRKGQLFVHRVLSALAQNQETFRKTIVFITYDEHGGLYDHVPPPSACVPEKSQTLTDYAFDRYGMRVPLLVVSAYLKRAGYVSHTVTDHTSITRFVEHWLELPALSGRDANAWPLLDFFDFDREPLNLDLPDAPVVSSPCTETPACLEGIGP